MVNQPDSRELCHLVEYHSPSAYSASSSADPGIMTANPMLFGLITRISSAPQAISMATGEMTANQATKAVIPQKLPRKRPSRKGGQFWE